MIVGPTSVDTYTRKALCVNIILIHPKRSTLFMAVITMVTNKDREMYAFTVESLTKDLVYYSKSFKRQIRTRNKSAQPPNPTSLKRGEIELPFDWCFMHNTG